MRMMLRAVAACLVTVWIVSGMVTRRAGASDPRKGGPHLVGVRTEVLVDVDRVCPITGRKRTLVTEIWYPAAPSAASSAVNRFEQFWPGPFGTMMGKVAIGAFGGNFVELNRHFENAARRDAPPAEGEFPLLVFSHGNGGFRFQNTFQMEYLASHGYVVAACDHPGNAAVTLLQAGPVIYNKRTIKDVRRWDDRPKDVSFLVTQFEKLNGRSDWWLHGRIRKGPYGALGHSFGGFTVSRLAELDPRVAAILPMTLAGTLFDAQDLATSAEVKEQLAALDVRKLPCKIPLMVILADHDRTVHDEGNRRSKQFVERAVGPRYLLVFKNAGHFTFTEMRQINPNFGDGIGTEKGKDGRADFAFSDAAEAQRITNQYSVAFFDAYLKNAPSARRFLAKNHDPDHLTYRKWAGELRNEEQEAARGQQCETGSAIFRTRGQTAAQVVETLADELGGIAERGL